MQLGDLTKSDESTGYVKVEILILYWRSRMSIINVNYGQTNNVASLRNEPYNKDFMTETVWEA